MLRVLTQATPPCFLEKNCISSRREFACKSLHDVVSPARLAYHPPFWSDRPHERAAGARCGRPALHGFDLARRRRRCGAEGGVSAHPTSADPRTTRRWIRDRRCSPWRERTRPERLARGLRDPALRRDARGPRHRRRRALCSAPSASRCRRRAPPSAMLLAALAVLVAAAQSRRRHGVSAIGVLTLAAPRLRGSHALSCKRRCVGTRCRRSRRSGRRSWGSDVGATAGAARGSHRPRRALHAVRRRRDLPPRHRALLAIAGRAPARRAGARRRDDRRRRARRARRLRAQRDRAPRARGRESGTPRAGFPPRSGATSVASCSSASAASRASNGSTTSSTSSTSCPPKTVAGGAAGEPAPPVDDARPHRADGGARPRGSAAVTPAFVTATERVRCSASSCRSSAAARPTASSPRSSSSTRCSTISSRRASTTT